MIHESHDDSLNQSECTQLDVQFSHTMVSLPIRKTHSAKARKSTSRKKGKAKKHQLDIHHETNVGILVPKSNEEKDKQRKEQLLQEVFTSFHVFRHLNKVLSAYLPIRVYVDQQEEKEIGEVYRTVLIRNYLKLQTYLWLSGEKSEERRPTPIVREISVGPDNLFQFSCSHISVRAKLLYQQMFFDPLPLLEPIDCSR